MNECFCGFYGVRSGLFGYVFGEIGISGDKILTLRGEFEIVGPNIGTLRTIGTLVSGSGEPRLATNIS
jgi:hypothetical protein